MSNGKWYVVDVGCVCMSNLTCVQQAKLADTPVIFVSAFKVNNDLP